MRSRAHDEAQTLVSLVSLAPEVNSQKKFDVATSGARDEGDMCASNACCAESFVNVDCNVFSGRAMSDYSAAPIVRGKCDSDKSANMA